MRPLSRICFTKTKQRYVPILEMLGTKGLNISILAQVLSILEDKQLIFLRFMSRQIAWHLIETLHFTSIYILRNMDTGHTFLQQDTVSSATSNFHKDIKFLK